MRFLFVYGLMCMATSGAVPEKERVNNLINEELILAAFKCDFGKVSECFAKGADAKYQRTSYDKTRFPMRDGGYSVLSSFSWTALMALSWCRGPAEDQIKIAKLLLENGADIDHADYAGGTCLHCAIMTEKTELVLFLLDRGANPNTALTAYIDEIPGETPLHCATVRSDLLVGRLIKAGANVNARNSKGESPLDYAKGRYERSAQILRRAGGK